MKELMIHEWKDDYLKLPLDQYILTFDDGLYSQFDGIKKINNVFDNIEIRVYISTNILHRGNESQTWNECQDAHERYFESGITTDFLNYDQLLELSKLDNVEIGIHGHNHLNLDALAKNKSLKDQLDIWNDDIKEMLFSTIRLIEQRIIDIRDLKLHYCTPYNQLNSLHTAIMRKEFQMYFPYVEMIITGPDRSDIETLLKLA